MAGLVARALDLLFGKPKAVKLGPPGQEAAGRELKKGAPTAEEQRESDDPGYQLDFTDPSNPEGQADLWVLGQDRVSGRPLR